MPASSRARTKTQSQTSLCQQPQTQTEELKTDYPKRPDELSSGKDDCFLVSDPTDDFYEHLGAWFADCKPVEKDVPGYLAYKTMGL